MLVLYYPLKQYRIVVPMPEALFNILQGRLKATLSFNEVFQHGLLSFLLGWLNEE
jgi:hypothetical protein